jgi:short-subunit dehydrogenase involved in D-alanine esterification of teichoic acids
MYTGYRLGRVNVLVNNAGIIRENRYEGEKESNLPDKS